MNYNER
ncbi:hypothetical protein F383_08137 [Gossypium arboreum]|nr:hypothetical protein F383_08137 [Gossypium arboreum]